MGILLEFGDVYFKNISDEQSNKFLKKGAQFLLECKLDQNFLFFQADCYLIGAFYSSHVETGMVELDWIDDVLNNSIHTYPFKTSLNYRLFDPVELEQFALYFSSNLWDSAYKRGHLASLSYKDILSTKFQHFRSLSDLYNGIY
ncbi:MAG: hypothetical protein ACREV6_24555 [Clostridium sp.]|uniref:hypothetical protein n=1 Tax=Clostridium sp. TaxID=1506 RepID=UPI003D6D3A46